MATLPAGNFLTTVSGRQCTAVPRSVGGGGGGGGGNSAPPAATSTTTSASTPPPPAQTLASGNTSPPPPPPPPEQKSTPQQVQAPPAVVSSSSSPPPSATTSSIPPVVAAAPPPPSTTNPTSSSAPVAVAPQDTSSPTTADAPSTGTPLAPTTPQESSIPSALPISNSGPIASSDNTAPQDATPTTPATTPVAQENGDISSIPTPSPTTLVIGNGSNNGGPNSLGVSMPSSTASSVPGSEASSSDGSISSTPRRTVAPLVGGLLGSMGFIAAIALLFFCLRRRKARRESRLPLGNGSPADFYRDEKLQGARNYDEKWDSNSASSGSGSQVEKLRSAAVGIKSGIVGLGLAVKSKMGRDRSGSTPSVDLNRGNSQFLDGPIPQHSRNNSVQMNRKVALKERVEQFYDRTKEEILWKIRMRKTPEPADPFAAARDLNNKQSKLNNPQPDFSQLLGMGDRELQLESERRRANIDKTQSVSSLPSLGSLGLSFSSMRDFQDSPLKITNPSPPTPGNENLANPFADPKNPFADTISQPQPSVAKQNTYIADVRRSRGLSIDTTDKGALSGATPIPLAATAGGPASRYPSTIARDSYRDTFFSTFSTNARKGKGRSDPFDLERPELWQRTNNENFNPGRPPLASAHGSAMPAPLTINNLQTTQPGYEASRIVSQDVEFSAVGTYGSKYSSGVSSLSGWGDPGPDLGPGSSNASIRGGAGNNRDSNDLERTGVDGGGVSPLSTYSGTSGKHGVGKAM